MDFSRGSSKKFVINGGSSKTRNLIEPIYQQIETRSETSVSSFPRQSVNQGRSEGFEGAQVGPFPEDDLQNVPPTRLEETLPFPPKRSTSLFNPRGASTLTLRHSKGPRESPSSSSLLNPKRISIATSSFWLDHPDMEKFANTLDFSHETIKTQSVWGASEKGSGGAECVDIWGDPPAVKKGVLLQQREKLWSRWKERYIILTRDYLNCFRRSTSIHRSGVTLSEMGSFLFKLRLADVDSIRWENRRNGSLVAIVLPQEPRILLRVPNDNTEALHQWYTLLQECVYMSKERRQALRNNHTSTYGKTYSTTKSNPFNDRKSLSSQHSSLDEPEEGKEGNEQNNNETRHSLRKNSSNLSINANGTTSGRKYSGNLEDTDDYDEAEYSPQNISKVGGGSSGGTSGSEADEFVPVSLQRVSAIGGGIPRRLTRSTSSNLTLNDFVRTPWRVPRTNEGEEETSSLEEIAQIRNGAYSPGSPTQTRRLSSGYAIPVDSLLRQNNEKRNKRPESWSVAPVIGTSGRSNLFYRTPTLVPSQCKNKRDLSIRSSLSGLPFNRSTMIVCPSRLTSEVTYIRRM